MRRVHGSFLVALGAAALGLAVPAVASAQEPEPQPEATPQESPVEAVQEVLKDEKEASMESNDLVAVARAQGNLTRFLAIVEEAGLTHELSIGGPYTIFAPTDDAFAAAETAESGSAADLRHLVRTHIAVGDWSSEELSDATGITNLLADELTLGEMTGTETEGTLQIAGANVVKSDIDASNGVIHKIDAVIDSRDAAVAAAGD